MATKEKIDSLTGIRFWAAACIVIGHAHITFGSANLAINFALSQGVSLFFILSGFILAYTYPSLNNIQDTKKFFIARFSRLYPLHFATILILLVLVPADYAGYLPLNSLLTIITNLLLIQSWIPIRDLNLSLNGVSWSISTEIFFYLAFPFLLYMWKEKWLSKVLLVTLLLITIIIASNILKLPADDSYKYFGLFSTVYTHPLSRIFEFTIGIVAFSLYKQLLPLSKSLNFKQGTFLEICSLLLVIFSMWITPIIAYQPGVKELFGDAGVRWIKGSGSFYAFAILILIVAFQKGALSYLLRTRIMILGGEISFALYLVHTIILNYYNYKNFILPNTLGYILYWALILLISFLLFKGVEQPSRQIIRSVAGINKSTTKTNRTLFDKKAFAYLTCLVIIVFNFKFLELPSSGNLEFVKKGEVPEIINNSSWTSENTTFNNELALVSIDSEPYNNESIKLDLLWESQKDLKLNHKIGIHFIDDNNNIINQTEHEYKNADHIEKNSYWVDSIIIPKDFLENAKGIAIALYERPDAFDYFLPVTNGQSDWNRYRLIIKDINTQTLLEASPRKA